MKLQILNDQPKGVLVLPPNNLLSSNLLSSDEIAMGFSVVLLGEKKLELENLNIRELDKGTKSLPDSTLTSL